MATTQITAELVHYEVRQLRDEMRAAVDALNTRCDGLMDVINTVARNVAKMGGDPYAPLGTLPAQTPTEDQIVAALKADPAMAGRVVAHVAFASCHEDRCAMGDAAKAFVAGGLPSVMRAVSLQSLAVALAAASYRG